MKRTYDDAPKLLKDYLVYLQIVKNRSELTVLNYYTDLRLFFRFYKIKTGRASDDPKEFQNISIADITESDIKSVDLMMAQDFLIYTKNEKDNHPKARYRKGVALRQFFKYLTNNKALFEVSPLANLELPTPKAALPKYLTLEESVDMLSNIETPDQKRDYCIITFFLNCGMRLSELVGINFTDIRTTHDHNGKEIWTLKVIGKGNKERIIYLNDACVNAYNDYLNLSETDNEKRSAALEKARFALEKAKNNLTKKVWNGSQWVYTADTEAVQSAQEAYDDAEYEELTNSINDLVDVLEKLMKDHNLYDDNGNLTENGEEVKRVISDIDAKELPNVLKALIERGFSEEELTSIAKSNGVDISSQMHSDVLQSLMDNIRANPDMTKWLYDYENFPAPQINIPNVYDTANLASLTSAQQNNIPQSAMPVPQLNIQNTAVPDFTLPAVSGAGTVINNNFDKLELSLPNVNDNSKAYDLAMSLRNELMSLRTYSQQYNWNQ